MNTSLERRNENANERKIEALVEALEAARAEIQASRDTLRVIALGKPPTLAKDRLLDSYESPNGNVSLRIEAALKLAREGQ